MKLPPATLIHALQVMEASKSQLKQDIFVLVESGFKRGGYFVEFGATNGVELSNTHLLEKEFQWTGILAEPAKVWQNALKINRNCHIETDCVWKDSTSTLNFNEVESAEFSTIRQFSSGDMNSQTRLNGNNYDVKTISLVDLLDKYSAPRLIDYLSIDTEGSEYDILSHFDFKKYQFKIITVEHNFTDMREKLHRLLAQHGYQRKYTGFSRWDDWYVLAT